MQDFFIPQATENEIAKEKAKARKLRKDLTMDHVVPLIRGGKSTKNNIVPACKECNNVKKHKLPVEWTEYLENIKKQ